MKILLPKTRVDVEDPAVPFFFLAGPIKGGGDWQKECCLKLAPRLKEFVVVVPCRWQPDHPLYHYRLEGRDDVFDRQTNWEYYYLSRVAEYGIQNKGCIIFWLPEESKEHSRDDGQPYARDTYGELGRWSVRASQNRQIKLVVGGEPGFPGLSVIERNFSLDFKECFTIYPSLDQTVEVAVRCIA